MTRSRKSNSAPSGSTDATVPIEELALVGRLASRLSGETRQPLGVLRNAVYFLNQRLGDNLDDKVRHHLTLMLRSVEGLDGIVSNLAALAGADLQERQTADVQAIVDAAIGRVDTRPGVVIETAITPEAVIFCDPSCVRLAVTNVILNSVQAIQGEGRIRVVCQHVGRETRITVADDGPGMTKDVRAHVFEPFFTTASHRVGIGLTAVQRLVGASGGTVGIESTPGAGTTVTLTFPRHEGP